MNIEHFEHGRYHFDFPHRFKPTGDNFDIDQIVAPEGYRLLGNWGEKRKKITPGAWNYKQGRNYGFYKKEYLSGGSSCVVKQDFEYFEIAADHHALYLLYRGGVAFPNGTVPLHPDDSELKGVTISLPFAVPVFREPQIEVFLAGDGETSRYMHMSDDEKERFLKGNVVLMVDRTVYEMFMGHPHLVVPFKRYFDIFRGCKIEWYGYLYRRFIKIGKMIQNQIITKHERENIKEKLVEYFRETAN